MCMCITRKKGPLTFIVKSINPIDTGAFMISTKEEEILGVLDLISKKEANGL